MYFLFKKTPSSGLYSLFLNSRLEHSCPTLFLNSQSDYINLLHNKSLTSSIANPTAPPTVKPWLPALTSPTTTPSRRTSSPWCRKQEGEGTNTFTILRKTNKQRERMVLKKKRNEHASNAFSNTPPLLSSPSPLNEFPSSIPLPLLSNLVLPNESPPHFNREPQPRLHNRISIIHIMTVIPVPFFNP